MVKNSLDFDTIIASLDNNGAMRIIALFFAQPELDGKKPHELLGYPYREEALKDICAVIHREISYLKSVISYFDKHTDNHRKGWGGELEGHNKETFEKFSGWSTLELLELVQAILETTWAATTSELKDLGSLASDPLPDLSEILSLVRRRLDQVAKVSALTLSEEFLTRVKAAYSRQVLNDIVTIVDQKTFELKTAEGNYVYVSTLELARCWATLPYVKALQKYITVFEQFLQSEYSVQRTSGTTRDLCKELPSPAYDSLCQRFGLTDIESKIENYFDEEEHVSRFKKFLSDNQWSGIGKKLNRGDLLTSSIVKSGRWLAVAAERRGDFSIALATISDAEEVIELALPTENAERVVPPIVHKVGGENVIFYGAPGTGKSNKVDKEIAAKGKEPFRTVFHPDLQNSDFFGCLKPQLEGDKVSYKFAPGPFMEALAEAYSTPSEPVYLVIEELNRAAAAAVFGDLFLLLDRDDHGTGEYDVSFPSPESRAWFEAKTHAPHSRLRIPSNLFIYATMNSADQGVYPIDTAFRRRWRQEYLPLDYASGPGGNVGYTDVSGAPKQLLWRKFVELLNDHLTESHTLEIAEDRLLGQWFVKKAELTGNGIPEKVLLYLWDDLLRHDGREVIFDTSTIKTYGALSNAMISNNRFLSDGIIQKLNAFSKPVAETLLEGEDASE